MKSIRSSRHASSWWPFVGLTGWLIWRLAAQWFHGLAAAVPPFVYLSLVPVMSHGGSFRADSMLAPLLMAATLLCRPRGGRDRDELLAGLAIGIAAAVTIKVLLFAPMLVLLVVYGGLEPGNAGKRRAARAAFNTPCRS